MVWQVYMVFGIILLASIIITYVVAYNAGWKDRERAYTRIQSLRQERFEG